MILALLILILLVGGAASWVSGRRGVEWPRRVAAVTVGLDLAILIGQILFASPGGGAANPSRWLEEARWEWIPRLGIGFHVGMDGLSLILLGLTFLLGLLAVGSSWTEIRVRPGFFYFNLLWVLAGVAGVFVALDLFLFYFFWELMLVPMFLLIAIWGHEQRRRAAIKFFLFTQAGGLLMLLAILGLYFSHGAETGEYTFDYPRLLAGPVSGGVARWILMGFLAAFLVKLPAVPFHTWLPDAHTEAPTGGSVVLAGLLLKTGAFGLFRFALPLFPSEAVAVSSWLQVLGVIGILYGAVLAFAQSDLKRLVAYSSVSHMGFVLLGVGAGNRFALQGAILQLVCHGLSTGALFIVAGALQERTHTRDLSRLGGLWGTVPRLGGATLVFAMASLGLPGLGNFVAEFLVLLGTYETSAPAAVAAALGLVASAVYVLRLVQRVFLGPRRAERPMEDLSRRESVMAAVIILSLLGLGLYPGPVLEKVRPVVERLERPSPPGIPQGEKP